MIEIVKNKNNICEEEINNIITRNDINIDIEKE